MREIKRFIENILSKTDDFTLWLVPIIIVGFILIAAIVSVARKDRRERNTELLIVGIIFLLIFPPIGLVLLIICIARGRNSKNSYGDGLRTAPITEGYVDPLTYEYMPKWLLTYNEKYAYGEIKAAADELGMTVFTKVRLFDLVEPRHGASRYKTLQYKIQAKHVDFVLCNQKLVAETIIELDDSSHDTAARRERDAFVDEVLKNTGYNVLRYRQVRREIVKTDLENISRKPQARTAEII